MIKQKKMFLLGATAALPLVISCGSDSSTSNTSAYSDSAPSTVIGAVGAAISAAATDMTGSSLAQYKGSDLRPAFSADLCTDHGDPTSSYNWGSAEYPGLLTYCKMSKNDGSPDTIQGGFTLVKSISCALEAAGLTFDGVARSVNITLSSACFTAEQMADMGGEGATMAATVTASAPAAFNTNYTKGVVIGVEDMTFKLGSRVTDSKIEFITHEEQGATRTGMTAGSLDLSSGEVRFEARMERIDCTTDGSCGWNRHIRLYADMTMDGTTPKNLESISFGYSNTQAPPGQSGYGGVLITATGDLTSGIKARLWQATDGSSGSPTSQADYAVVGNWSEVTNSKCYTDSVDNASTCGTGLDKFSSSAAFVLTGTHSSPATFFGAITGQTYTAVDVNSDTQ